MTSAHSRKCVHVPPSFTQKWWENNRYSRDLLKQHQFIKRGLKSQKKYFRDLILNSESSARSFIQAVGVKGPDGAAGRQTLC